MTAATETETPPESVSPLLEKGSMELERASQAVELGRPAYTAYSPEVINLIKLTLLPAGSTNADLYMMLELSARYKLDPFRHEIWMIPGRSNNGAPGRPLIIVGRDGLIRTASRHKDYEGFDSDVHRENDSFKVTRNPDGYVEVSHSYEGGTATRGKVVGAWCVCYRKGRRPRYFYAPLEEYYPKNERKAQYSPWGSTESTMIEKCAIVTSHRMQFELSGIYDESEVANATDAIPQGGPSPLDYGDDPTLALYLGDLFAAAEVAKPGAYLPAKVRTTLQGRKTQEEREALALELVMFIEANGAEPPKRPAPVENENLTSDEEIEEAEFEEIDQTAKAEVEEPVAETADETVIEEVAEGEQETLPVE